MIERVCLLSGGAITQNKGKIRYYLPVFRQLSIILASLCVLHSLQIAEPYLWCWSSAAELTIVAFPVVLNELPLKSQLKEYTVC